MNNNLRQHYLSFGPFTYPSLYLEYFKSLPDDIEEIGRLVCSNVIHRVVLKNGNTKANSDLRYGDMSKFPWYRLRCEDDIFPTASAMITELFRLDSRGLVRDRSVENKIVVTCRYVSVLMTSILKSKGIPTRVRSGFAPYITEEYSCDHWINQYWKESENRWVTIDADGYFDNLDFNQYDIPNEKFDWAAKTWLGLRQGSLDTNRYYNAGGFYGLMPTLWAVFYDFHSLMNNEILYTQVPSYISYKFDKLTEEDFKEVDELAKLMLDPDKNFNELLNIWNTNRKFRRLNSPLVSDGDHISI